MIKRRSQCTIQVLTTYGQFGSIVKCSFTNQLVVDLGPVRMIYSLDIAYHAVTQCRFTLNAYVTCKNTQSVTNRLFSIWHSMKFLTKFETGRQTCVFQETNERVEQFHQYFPDNEYVFPHLEGGGKFSPYFIVIYEMDYE